jgi:hypothetical protein
MPMLRQVTVLARRWDLPVLAAVEGHGLRHRGLHDLRAAGGGQRRDHPDGAGLHGRAEVPRRADPLGRHRHDPFDAFGALGWGRGPKRRCGRSRRRGRFWCAAALVRPRLVRPRFRCVAVPAAGGRRRGRKAAHGR